MTNLLIAFFPEQHSEDKIQKLFKFPEQIDGEMLVSNDIQNVDMFTYVHSLWISKKRLRLLSQFVDCPVKPKQLEH